MKAADIIHHRLVHQRLVNSSFKTPQEIVSWMIAMQAQEYAMAKWAIGLRVPGLHDHDVETAFNEGKILRTHLLRPTWHFVTPEDIRWLLKLTAPRINALSAYMFRQLKLDSKLFKRTNDIIAKSLEGGKHLTRSNLQSILKKKKIETDGLRMGYIMMTAELDGIVCSGPRQGKQFTYALLEERVAPVKKIEKDEALAMLVKRYFTSRAPSTIQDFAHWSGLAMKDAKQGLAMQPDDFITSLIAPIEKRKTATFLMPDYDEYGMSYKDRSVIFNIEKPKNTKKDNPVFSHVIIVDGRLGGTWKRTIKNNKVIVETDCPHLSSSKLQAVKTAVKRYHSFVGKLADE